MKTELLIPVIIVVALVVLSIAICVLRWYLKNFHKSCFEGKKKNSLNEVIVNQPASSVLSNPLGPQSTDEPDLVGPSGSRDISPVVPQVRPEIDPNLVVPFEYGESREIRQILPQIPGYYEVSHAKPARKQISTGLIIAVDATPRENGGYCIIQDEQRCEYYSLETKLLPWMLNDLSRRGNPSEFEMKNMLFALLIWENLIVEHKKLWLYTDNMAVNGRRSRYGRRVRMFLIHLKRCKQVKIINKNLHMHSGYNPLGFKKYIIPADHLSRGRITSFKNSIQESYPFIYAFKTVDSLYENIQTWTNNMCTDCGFDIPKTGSLRKAHRNLSLRRI